MIKKRTHCLLVMVAVAALCLFGTQAGAQTFTLKFHHHNQGKTAEIMSRYAKSIEEATKGQVKIQEFPAATLGKPKEAYDLVTSKTADLSWGFTGFFPGQFPMTDLMTLPLMGGKSGKSVSLAYWALYEKFKDAFDQEYKEVKLLTLNSTGVIPTSTKTKAIRKMEDFQGMRLRTPAGPPTDMIKALGASPTTIGTGEIYSALERGIVEGVNFGIMAVRDFKLEEQLNYFGDTRLYATGFWTVMNKDVWNSLPKEIQDQIMSVSGAKGGALLGSGWDEIGDAAWEYLKTVPGKELITYSDEERARWDEKAKPIWDAYVKNLESKGLPGKEAFEYGRKMMKQFSN